MRVNVQRSVNSSSPALAVSENQAEGSELTALPQEPAPHVSKVPDRNRQKSKTRPQLFSRGSGSRGRAQSGDRNASQEALNILSHSRQKLTQPSTPTEMSGSKFLARFGSSTGEYLKTAGHRFFAKRAEAPAREAPHQYKVIHLPLKDQVRMTRIMKSMHQATDKTEYWMPAIAWRCIE